MSSQINLSKSCASNGKSPGCVRGFVRDRCRKCHHGSIACEMCLPATPTTPTTPTTTPESSPSSIATLTTSLKRPRKTISFTRRFSLEPTSSVAPPQRSSATGMLPSGSTSTLPSFSPKRLSSSLASSSPMTVSFALHSTASTSLPPASSSSASHHPLHYSTPCSPLHDPTSFPPSSLSPSTPSSSSSSQPTAASSCIFCKGGRKACEECFGLGYVQRVCQDCLRETHRNKRQRRASSSGHGTGRRGSTTTTTTTMTNSHNNPVAAARRKGSLPTLSLNPLESWNQMGVQMEEGWVKFKEQSKNQMEGGWSKFKEQVIVPLTAVARVGGGGGGGGGTAGAATNNGAATGIATITEEVGANENLPQEPTSEGSQVTAEQGPTTTTTTTTPIVTSSDEIKNETCSNRRENSEDSHVAGNTAADQQAHPKSRLSFKATVKKHLRVRPLFAIINNNNKRSGEPGESDGHGTGSSDPTGKEVRNNKRRRRHWSFPALLSPSLLRSASSAA